MSYRRLLLTCLAALFCASPAWAQFEEIVVTGSRINSDGYSRIPAIVLERRADFLVQRIRLTNDTRAEAKTFIAMKSSRPINVNVLP